VQRSSKGPTEFFLPFFDGTVVTGDELLVDFTDIPSAFAAPTDPADALSCLYFPDAYSRLVRIGVEEAVPPEILRQARQSLAAVVDILGGRCTPMVAALPDGSAIGFEWHHEPRVLIVEVSDAPYSCLLVEGNEDLVEAEYSGTKKLRELASWLLTGEIVPTPDDQSPSKTTSN